MIDTSPMVSCLFVCEGCLMGGLLYFFHAAALQLVPFSSSSDINWCLWNPVTTDKIR
jgi:hypothetical protein